jgi:two-component system, cell cycle sensor histidine kinase and response regulator CckA
MNQFLVSLGIWPVAVLTAIGIAAVWRIIHLSGCIRELRLEPDAAPITPAQPVLDPPLEASASSPDPDDLPVPVCVISKEGRPERVNRSFMAWHGGPVKNGLPEASKAIARLRLYAAKRAMLDDASVEIKDASVDAIELEAADGRRDRFTTYLTRIDEGADASRWCVLAPLPEAGNEEGLASILRDAPIGVAVVDRGGSVLEANSVMAKLLETPVNALKGRNFMDFVSEQDRPALTLLVSGGSDSDGEDGETELRMGEAGRVNVSAFVRHGLDPGRGRGYGAIVIYMIDISSQLDLEERMNQSQKMQAVGQLAGGIAHDFNNLLTAMTGFCDLLMIRHRSGDPSFADIMQIKQNANRAANLVRQLLAFSRQQTLIPRVIDVTEILADLSHLLRRLIGESIDLKINHGRTLKPVKVDQSQLEQVLVNLVVNARDAMEGRGTIQVRTYNVQVDSPLRRRDEVMPAGQYVLLEVGDTGSGISEENLDRVFEPFFTTKDVGSGTGLGLSTVYGIVKQTSGFVFVESVVGEGTKFSIYLPAHDGTVDRNADTTDTDRNHSGDLTGVGTVLLVEDEDPVRLFAARALRGKGYEVIEARSGENALAMLGDGTEPIDLLITDVMMPGMDGPTLIREVREITPNLPVICISGYSEDALRQRISEDVAIHFLAKPFSLKQLAGKVKEVIHV